MWCRWWMTLTLNVFITVAFVANKSDQLPLQRRTVHIWSESINFRPPHLHLTKDMYKGSPSRPQQRSSMKFCLKTEKTNLFFLYMRAALLNNGTTAINRPNNNINNNNSRNTAWMMQNTTKYEKKVMEIVPLWWYWRNIHVLRYIYKGEAKKMLNENISFINRSRFVHPVPMLDTFLCNLLN